MLTGKKLTPEMRQEILTIIPDQIYGNAIILDEHINLANRLVDEGYIAGTGLRSEFPEDLAGLGVWG